MSGGPITPALLMRTCKGPRQPVTNAATEAWSARSSGATRTSLLPVAATMSCAARSPAAGSRTARVTSAPTPASTRAVSKPMPEVAPVITTLRPDRSRPDTTSAAVDWAVKGVVMRVVTVVILSVCCAARPRRCVRRSLRRRNLLAAWSTGARWPRPSTARTRPRTGAMAGLVDWGRRELPQVGVADEVRFVRGQQRHGPGAYLTGLTRATVVLAAVSSQWTRRPSCPAAR